MELLCSTTFSFAISSLISFTVFGMHPENVLPSPSRCSKPYGNIPGSRRYHRALTADPASLLSYRMQPHPVPELSGTCRRFRPGVRSQIPYRSGHHKEYLHFSHILTGIVQTVCHCKLDQGCRAIMPDTTGNLSAHIYNGFRLITVR